MSSVGKRHRMARLINRDTGRTVIVALDHGLQHGPKLRGIGRIKEALAKVVMGKPDAVILNPGVVKSAFGDFQGTTGLLVKLTAFSPFHPHFDAPIGSVEEAIKLGADGVSVGFLFGSGYPRQVDLMRNLGVVVQKCLDWGIPLFVHAYPRGEKVPKEEWYSADRVKYAARAAAEIGADVVKTSYTGSPETFREVVLSCPVPVVQAGGPRVGSNREFLGIVEGSLRAGAMGVTVGRNVFMHEHPDSMIRAIRAVVHEGSGVEEALREMPG